VQETDRGPPRAVIFTWRERYAIYPGKLQIAIPVVPLLIIVCTILVQLDIAVEGCLAGLAALYLGLIFFVAWVFKIEYVLVRSIVAKGTVTNIEKPKDRAFSGMRIYTIRYTYCGKDLMMRKMKTPAMFMEGDGVHIVLNPSNPKNAYLWRKASTKVRQEQI